MAEVIGPAFANPVAENLANAIWRQFGYLWHYRKKMDNLEKQVTTLESKIIDMNLSVNVAIRNAEEIGDQVEKWLSEAKDISVQARNFLEEHKERREMRCLVGLCPNLVSRHQFGRRACKKGINVADVITKEGQIREVSFRAVGHERAILSTEGFFTFDSRKPILEDIMKALQVETKSLFGVYGFGGMGKTTLAKQVASRAKEEKLFEEIVLASVTQKVDVKEMQGQIASMLDLKLEESTRAERASRIHQRLKGKKVLVILDDLWEDLDLKEVGVPFGPEHMGCKILLTSRFRHVLTSMGAGKDFNLGALDEEEAWRLFEEKVGGRVLENSNFHNIGKEVAKRCQGLPVLIVTVAASLSKRPQLSAWNDALNQLKKMNKKEMHDIVNSAIESISYSHLEKTHKQLFLLCGVIGGVASIEEVLQYSLGWNLFYEEAATIQNARDRLHTLILDLKESCLLLDVNERNSIKMHDVVRDVAISIGKKDFNMFSIGEHDAELNIWRRDDNLQMCTAMVFRGCPNLPCLPPLLECPSLELFVMSGFSWDSSPSIPETFFEKTNKLKVLGMSRLIFSALPPSLSFLKNLQTLRVNRCYILKDISIVGGLKKLQTLSFANTSIEELPSEIGQLPELRSLDVRGCSQLKVIPVGLIKGLSRLEELYVGRDFNRWEAEECVNGSVQANASPLELKHLPDLCNLEIRVRDDKLLLEDLHFEKLERYEIIVGDMWDIYSWLYLDKLRDTRKICLQLSTTSINHLQHGVKMLFKSTECLWLGELKDFKNVIPALDGDGFPNLKHLRIHKDYEIQHIVNVEDKQRKASFSSLESLQLIRLLKLQKICNGLLMKESFCNLTTMGVDNCSALKSLFSFSMATALPRLQEIEVSNCDALEAIVAEKNMNDDGVNINDGVCEEIEFAQLRKLSLKQLPKLKNFFSNDEIQNKSHKSRSPEIHTKEELKSSLPFFSKVSFPKLKELELLDISNLTEIWSHKVSENYLLIPSASACCDLTKLTIIECKSLKHVFPAFVAPSLNKLEILRVEDCESMKTIIGGVNHEEEIIKATQQNVDAATFMFAKLTKVCLERLPKVESFYQREHTIECPALMDLNVAYCGKLYAFDFLSFPQKQGDYLFGKVMSKIENLSIRSIDLMKILTLYDHFPTHLFSSLKRLDIVEFHGASVVLLSEFLNIIYNQLREFRVYNCSFQEIFPYGEVTNHANDHIRLHQLMGLKLQKLPELKYICKHYQHSPLILNILDRLKYVEVEGCPRLTNLVPPSVSFRSLVTLIVTDCGLTNLIQPSTATSLEQLWSLNISGCEMMEQVIGDDEESSRDDNEIIFPNLLWLELEKLPRLTNFCSSPNYTFNFPELSWLNVKGCPNMKTFCGGITTTPRLNSVEYEGERRWEGDINTTVQHIFSETEAKILTIALPTTLSINHVGGNADVLENSSEELTEPIIPTVVQICQNATNIKKESEVSENPIGSRKGTETFEEGTVRDTREKGKELEVFEEVMEHSRKFQEITRHSDTSTHNYTPPEQTVEGSVASSSKLSNRSEEFQRLATALPSTSSNKQEAEIHGKAAEPTKEHQICKHVVDDISGQGTFTDKAIEPSIATEISEELVERGGKQVDICAQHVVPSTNTSFDVEDQLHYKSSKKISDEPIIEAQICADKFAKMKVRELAPLLPSTSSTNQFEAAAQVPENSAKAQNDATNAERMADTFEEGSLYYQHAVASSEETNPPAETKTSLSHSTELEVRRLTSTVESEATNPRKAGETSNHSEMESLARTSSPIHFIPLLSEFLQMIQNQPLKSMSAEHVQFMEDAFRDLSTMNFSIEWFIPYVQKARECLPVLESRREISELESEIAKMEAELETVKEKKKALEEKYEGVASHIDLDKSLHDS